MRAASSCAAALARICGRSASAAAAAPASASALASAGPASAAQQLLLPLLRAGVTTTAPPAPEPKPTHQAPPPAPNTSPSAASGTPPVGPQDYTIALKAAQQLAGSTGQPPIGPGEAGLLSGHVPLNMQPNKVLIYSAARCPEQQGRQRTSFNRSTPAWGIEFIDPPAEKWVNRLMGWTSTGDSARQSNVALNFFTWEEAARFCDKHGWAYEVQPPLEPRTTRSKRWASYGDNFSTKRHGAPDLAHLPSNAGGAGHGGGGAGVQLKAGAGAGGN
ncbi:hypothetical protein HYH03_000178 [Edaphochlamys debaryana]|uniref:NADH dehydrogenase [ubiquinone] iron-sulfur protein 4, mitochondrial n=1 Tax=Edaphochlamys debaryana TaxID=47281 RepID=A0A835YF40_9CHLO|nr:hypothetical protein HYH03_000178 [Edaphochlamys debaryana]|eukprot:KAG2501675.1 hypothetical protein HYH03_000178 [Edaphochlamys debaryana]